METITKAFLSADIFLYKLNNKHIKKLFHEVGYSLLPETTCRKTVLHFSAVELQQIKNAVSGKQIFLVVDVSTVSGIKYLNILFESLETSHISCLYGCQSLSCASNISIIA